MIINFEMVTEINQADLENLLALFKKKEYNAQDCIKGSIEESIISQVEEFFKADYNLLEVENIEGELCSHYPARILIPEERISTFNFHNKTTSPKQKKKVTNELKNSINLSKFARCRKRFPIPVILYNGKYICRSATISLPTETESRNAFDWTKSSNITNETKSDDNMSEERCKWFFRNYHKILNSDVKLLKSYNVGTIIDLMVEDRKVKYWLYVATSEKVDKTNRYDDFHIMSIPYPGCEFFKDYRDSNYVPEKLVFDWTQSFINAPLKLPKKCNLPQLEINWNEYKQWDLVKITQNYLKLILKYINENSTGILIHCISGWDRTPLFISLIRISLWADRLIHQSLNPYQLTFLTIAYDWYLFGHKLPDRVSKHEEVLLFCFHFLKYISDDEFSLRDESPAPSSNDDSSSIEVINEDECDESCHSNITIETRDTEMKDVFTETILNGDENASSQLTRENLEACNRNYFNATKKSSCWLSQQTNILSVPEITQRRSSSNEGSIIIVNEDSLDADISEKSVFLKDTPSPSIDHEMIDNNNPDRPRTPNNPISPLKHTRTSPVAIPYSVRARQRNDSTSSMDNWHVVTETGSIASSPNKNQTMCDAKNPKSRKERLRLVRTILIKAYVKSVGLKGQEGHCIGEYLTGLVEMLAGAAS